MNQPTAKHQEEAREIAVCPFCPHGIGFIRNESGRYNGVVWVECDWPSHAVRLTAGADAAAPCGARTAEYQTEEDAVKAWNTRVPSAHNTQIREVLEGLSYMVVSDGVNHRHWCGRLEPCTPTCLAARELWERVQDNRY